MSAGYNPFTSYTPQPQTPLLDAGITPDQLTTLGTSPSSTSHLVGISDVLSSVGNLALGAFALSKLPSSRIPVPQINTPYPFSTAATSVSKYASVIIIGLLAVAAIVAVILLRRR